MTTLNNSISGAAASPLGKTVAYCSEYSPELLFPIPRSGKREEIGVSQSALPFVGEDLWGAYEISWLNPRGKPVVALGEFCVPAHSPCLIESKSLKLYLNSFNQTVCASVEEARAWMVRDLSHAAGASVSVRLETVQEAKPRNVGVPQGVCVDDLDIEIRDYQPRPDFLTVDDRVVKDEVLYSHLLKSNCLVTGQPDWGLLGVRYQGAAINREGLLRYIVSLRQHNEFHEQCVERVFVEIMQRCQPSKLLVWARYTRRGGLDINPMRASEAGFVLPWMSEIRQ